MRPTRLLATEGKCEGSHLSLGLREATEIERLAGVLNT